MKRKNLFVPIVLILFFSVLAVNAQISEKITLHGFGAWGYGNTDGNHYMIGDEDGDYDHAQFYLNINANPFEKLSIIAQIGAVQGHEGVDFEFDYAFAEWAFSDHFKLRLGKVKHAFGIYGEVLNVGTIRPFFSLPQGIYGRHGFVGTGVNGISITGNLMSKSGWGFTYDIYAGQLRTISELPAILGAVLVQDLTSMNDSLVTYERNTSDLLGGRVSFITPVEGLSFGLSGYFGEDKGGEEEGQGGYAGDQESWGFFMEYLTADVTLRGEYVKHTVTADTGRGQVLETPTDAYYFEAAYKFLNHWQVAARYDFSEGEILQLDMSMMPRFFQEHMKHKDISLGINYWFNSNFVIKLSYHMVEGIQFAWPQFDDAMAFIMGDFDNKTKLVQFGVHFSF
jgi:hypothetical protein